MGKRLKIIFFLLAYATFGLSSSVFADDAEVTYKDENGIERKTTLTIAESDADKIKQAIRADPCGFWFGTYERATGRITAPADNSKIQQLLSNLDYMGIKFVGPATCVIADNDNAGFDACGGVSHGKRAINPMNPQYWDSNTESFLRGLAGASGVQVSRDMDRDSNPFNFYLCVPRTATPYNNSKAEICRQENFDRSSDWENKSTLDINFERGRKPNGDISTDGNCMCRQKGAGSSSPAVLCQRELQFNDICEQNNLLADDRSPKPSQGTYCKCRESGAVTVPGSTAAAQPIYVAPDQGATCSQQRAVAEAAAPPTAPTPAFVTCMDRWKEKAALCKREADSAVSACRSSGDNSLSVGNEAGQVITGLAGALTNSKAGTGAQDTCFKASLLANAASMALGNQNNTCGDTANTCRADCGSDKFQKFEDECRGMMQASNPLDQQYWNQHSTDIVGEIRTNFTDGTRICSQDVPRQESDLEKALTGLGNSLQSSTRCACQLSSTGTSSCDSIPNPSTCASNPSAAGCDIYGALNVCTVGATYDAALCACQLNPKGAGCPGATSNAISGFASGAMIKSIAADAGLSGFGSTASGAGKSATDLSLGGDDPTNPYLNANTPSNKAATLGAVGGGGAGAGGGAGGGRDGNPNGGIPVEEDGLIKSLFNQAKIAGSALFGKSKANGDSSAGGKGKGAIDPSAYKPNRGIASRDGYGSKNMDIWKMMSNCVQGESCSSNINSYIQTAP